MEILGLDRFAKVGKIGKAHALSGEVKLSFEQPLREEALTRLPHLFVEVVSPPIPFFIEEIKQAPQPELYLVRFESIRNKEQATIISNTDIYLLKEEVEKYFRVPEEAAAPPEEELDLTGFTMIDKQLGTVGKIEQITEMPQQLLAQLSINDQEVMVPLNEETIVQVHEETAEIHVNLPEGLLDVYLGRG